MDVVYIVIETKDGNEELLYSLRSLKNIKHNNVYIIGHKPKWCKNIIHIPAEDPYDIKSLNALHKIKIACEDERISGDFILMNDDFYILEPTKIDYYNKGTIVEHLKYREDKKQINGSYYNNLKKTFNLFPNGNDFSLHCPIVYNKNKFLDLFKEYDMKEGYLLRNLYCNHYGIIGEYQEDCKIYNGLEVKIKNNQKFLSSDDKIIKDKKFKIILNKYFNEESNYEDNNLYCKNINMHKTIKLKFIKSIYPYKKGDIVDYRLEKYSKLIKEHTEVFEIEEKKVVIEKKEVIIEEIEAKKPKKRYKRKNKAILSNNYTK